MAICLARGVHLAFLSVSSVGRMWDLLVSVPHHCLFIYTYFECVSVFCCCYVCILRPFDTFQVISGAVS